MIKRRRPLQYLRDQRPDPVSRGLHPTLAG